MPERQQTKLNAIMKENQLTLLGRAAVLLLTFSIAVTAFFNIAKGQATNPYALFVVFVGLACFSIAKISVISKGHKVSFGTKLMSEGMANLYRLGYWLMAVGVMLTFMRY